MLEKFLAGRRRGELSDGELAALEASVDAIVEFPARQIIVPHGKRVETCMLLLEGFMTRYMDGADGERQLVALHVPGDFVDLHSFPLRVLDHDVGSMTPVKVARFTHEAIERLIVEFPNLARQMWFSTLLDAAMHREWIFRLGRLGASGRVAHLFAETERRLRMVGLSEGRSFALPLQQSDIASACGITPVHTNRVLRDLRERNVVTFSRGTVRILDLAQLHREAEFDDGYLYPSDR
ncbi:HTH crp-type domain-containing protein [Sphingomonas antarctica]|uniref:Crp/Fnr family transcriptional regulator n=1 Tax=Sphingomonas antarctica TaxID=2040274 RepID=UPI0039E839CC